MWLTTQNDFKRFHEMSLHAICVQFLRKKNKHTHYGHLCVSKCPCMDWNKKTHKLWSFVSKCPCMDCSFLQNTTSMAIFWYSWYFCGYFVYLQPHKTDSHTGKKTPKFMDKSSHKTPFCGSGQTDRRTDKVNPVYPPSNFVGRGYNNLCETNVYQFTKMLIHSISFSKYFKTKIKALDNLQLGNHTS